MDTAFKGCVCSAFQWFVLLLPSVVSKLSVHPLIFSSTLLLITSLHGQFLENPRDSRDVVIIPKDQQVVKYSNITSQSGTNKPVYTGLKSRKSSQFPNPILSLNFSVSSSCLNALICCQYSFINWFQNGIY